MVVWAMKWVAIVDEYYDRCNIVDIANGRRDGSGWQGHKAAKAARKLALGLLER
jgi:hypothetical protein